MNNEPLCNKRPARADEQVISRPPCGHPADRQNLGWRGGVHFAFRKPCRPCLSRSASRYSPRPTINRCSAVTSSLDPEAETSRNSSGSTAVSAWTSALFSLPSTTLQTVSPFFSLSMATDPSGVETSVPSAKHPPPPRAHEMTGLRQSRRTADHHIIHAIRTFLDS